MDEAGAPPPEPDFSQIPLPERCVDKNWKARLSAYSDLVIKFSKTSGDDDPFFRPYLNGEVVKKWALDSNAAAQEKGLEALAALIKESGENSIQTRAEVMPAVVDKCFMSMRAGTRTKAVEIALLYVEVENNGEHVVQEVIRGLDAKQPKLVATTVTCLRELVNAYGIKTLGDVKVLIKAVIKIFNHNDKTVRSEGTLLVQSLYKYLGPALAPSLIDLKPVQQKELTEGFATLDAAGQGAGTGKPTRLTRKEQQALESAPPASVEDERAAQDGQDPAADFDPLSLIEAVDIVPRLPASFHEVIVSPKWKDKVELLADCMQIINATPKIIDNPALSEVAAALGKRMTDTNVNVVSASAGMIAALATQVENHGFGKYKSSVIPPILDRLKEKKTMEALGKALDAIFATISFSEINDDCVSALSSKNPMVRQGTLQFIARSLQTTRTPPSKADLDALAPAIVSQLGDSLEPVRSAAAEGLGSFSKIFGERPMNPYLENITDAQRSKINEAMAKVEVKCKGGPAAKPASAPKPPPSAAPSAAPAKPKMPARLAARLAGGAAPSSPAPKPSEPAKRAESPRAPPPATKSGGSTPPVDEFAAPTPVKRPAGPPARLMARAAPAAKKPTPTPAAPRPAAAKSGGGTKASAPVSYEVKFKYSPEEAEAKAADIVPPEIQAGLGNAQWKERLASAEQLLTWVEQGPGAQEDSEILFRFLSKIPGWNEKNFQVSSKVFAALAAIASQNASFAKSSAAIAVGPLTDKLGDIKLKKPAGEALTVFAEKTSLGFVLSQGYESMTKQKAPKAQADALVWVKQAITEFGIKGLALKDLIGFLKVGLQSSNAAVRSSATATLVTVKLFLQADLTTFLEDLNPALLNTINGEFEKIAGQSPPEPTRESEDLRGGADEGAADAGVSGGDDPLDDLIPRVDLNKIVASTTVIKDAKSDAWKIRKAAFEQLNAELERHTRLKPEMGEISNTLRVHLDDSNLMVKILCLQIIDKIATGMGQPFQAHSRGLANGVAMVCGDQKVTTRSAALNTLSIMTETCQGLDTMIPGLAASLGKPNPVLRGSVLAFIAASFEKYPPKADLSPLVTPTLTSLEDRSGDVRKAAQAVLPFVVANVGLETVMGHVSKLKPASKSTVTPLVQAARVASASTPEAEIKPDPKPTITATPRVARVAPARSPRPSVSTVPPAAAPAQPKTEPVRARGMQMKNNALRASQAIVPDGDSRVPGPGRINGGLAARSRLGMARPVAASSPEIPSAETLVAPPFHTTDFGPKALREKRDLARWSYDVSNVAPLLEYLQKQMTPHTSPELLSLLFSNDRLAEKDHMTALTRIDELYSAEDDAPPFDLSEDAAHSIRLANIDLALKYTGVRMQDGSTQMILKCLEIVHHIVEAVDRAREGFSEAEGNVILPALIFRLGDNKFKDKLTAIFGLIDRTMPASRVMQFYVDHGISSSSAKTRAAAMEQLAQLIRRRGDVAASATSASRTYKRIAEFISSPDSATRSAALDCIAYMHHHTGDAVLTTIGELPSKERDLLANRIDKLRSGVVDHEQRTQTPSSPRIDSPSPQKPATNVAYRANVPVSSPSASARARRIPTAVQSRDRITSHNSDSSPFRGNDIAGPSVRGPPRLSESRMDPGDMTLDDGSKVSLAIRETHSSDPTVSVNGLKKIQRMLMSIPDDIIPYSNHLAKAIATRLQYIFADERNIFEAASFRLAKHLIQTLSNFCDHPHLVETVSGDNLKDLIGQLSLGLLLTDNADGDMKDMSRFMNMSILRLFATGPRITIFDALFKLLRDLVLDLTEADKETDLKAKHAELILKCIWKRSRTAEEDFKKGVLEAQDLFTIIEEFLQVISPKEWRIRAARKVPLGDMPLRTVKVLIQHAVSGLGPEHTYACLEKTYGEMYQATFVYEYIFRISSPSDNGSTPIAETAATPPPEPTQQSPGPTNDSMQRPSSRSKQASPAPAQTEQPVQPSPPPPLLVQDELDKELEELIKQASRPSGSKRPAEALASFLKSHPDKQAKFEELLNATLGSSPFKMFIKRSVDRYLQEDDSKPATTLSPSTTSNAPTQSPKQVDVNDSTTTTGLATSETTSSIPSASSSATLAAEAAAPSHLASKKRPSLAPGPPIPADADADTRLAMLKDKFQFFAQSASPPVAGEDHADEL